MYDARNRMCGLCNVDWMSRWRLHNTNITLRTAYSISSNVIKYSTVNQATCMS